MYVRSLPIPLGTTAKQIADPAKWEELFQLPDTTLLDVVERRVRDAYRFVFEVLDECDFEDEYDDSFFEAVALQGRDQEITVSCISRRERREAEPEMRMIRRQLGRFQRSGETRAAYRRGVAKLLEELGKALELLLLRRWLRDFRDIQNELRLLTTEQFD